MATSIKQKEIESVCTYCGVGCDITAVVEDNKIVKIYAQNDGEVSQGKLCIKGKYGYDFVEAKDRIREPRIKRRFLEKNPHIAETYSSKLTAFDSDYMTCDLESATAIIAQKLSEVKTAYGATVSVRLGVPERAVRVPMPFRSFVARRWARHMWTTVPESVTLLASRG